MAFCQLLEVSERAVFLVIVRVDPDPNHQPVLGTVAVPRALHEH